MVHNNVLCFSKWKHFICLKPMFYIRIRLHFHEQKHQKKIFFLSPGLDPSSDYKLIAKIYYN